MSEAQPTVKSEVKPPALNPRGIRFGETARNVHVVPIPPKVTVDDVMDPDFWAHCTGVFKEGDKVECRSQDNAWYAELMVAAVGTLLVKMWRLLYVDLSAAASGMPRRNQSEFAVTWGGPLKWRVVRLSDKEQIHTGEPTKESAEQWIAGFVAGTVKAD